MKEKVPQTMFTLRQLEKESKRRKKKEKEMKNKQKTIQNKVNKFG